jgi:hypothetical protein
MEEYELKHRIYNRLRSRDSQFASVTEHPGFFQTDSYPVGVPMYSPLYTDAYIDGMIVRMSKDVYQTIGVNLLNNLISATLEESLKTVKSKDFSKEEKDITDAIQQLEKQLDSVESAIAGKIQAIKMA